MKSLLLLKPLHTKTSRLKHRAEARYFRLVWPLRALKCEQVGGVWGHAPPAKFLKLDTEIAFEDMFGPKMLLEFSHL